MDLAAAQAQFLKLMDGVQAQALNGFLQWIHDTFSTQQNGEESSEGDLIMHQIISELQALVPVQATFPDEHIVWPSSGLDSDLNPEHTVHVDAFLYGSDDDVDELCDKGLLSRNYCTQCGSQCVKPLSFISYSLSRDQVKFIFKELLPSLRGKTVLDVGCRLGALVYGAYLYSDASTIVGVEISVQFCALVRQMVNQFNMSDRVQIVTGDIASYMNLVQQADVILIHNAFQFFQTVEDQAALWCQIRANSKKGQVFVTVPSLQLMSEHLQLNFVVDEWITAVPIDHCVRKFAMTNAADADKVDELSRICVYQVR